MHPLCKKKGGKLMFSARRSLGLIMALCMLAVGHQSGPRVTYTDKMGTTSTDHQSATSLNTLEEL
jgi:hypothetical protein